MIDRLLDAAIRFRWAVVIITLMVAVYGAFQLVKLPIDAVPGITLGTGELVAATEQKFTGTSRMPEEIMEEGRATGARGQRAPSLAPVVRNCPKVFPLRFRFAARLSRRLRGGPPHLFVVRGGLRPAHSACELSAETGCRDR